MGNRRVHVVISGWVQGVGFRASCQHQAVALGLHGWVRNQWDDTVEAVFEGPDEAVEAMLRWCHHGPPAAEVTGVQVEEAPDEPSSHSFYIRS